MAALDFPNSPTSGQQYAATNGATYQWDGVVWTMTGMLSPAGGDLQGTYPNPTIKPSALPWTPSGATLTPTDATKTVMVPGPGTASQFVCGPSTAKGRLLMNPSSNYAFIMSAKRTDADGQDTAAIPSWQTALNLTAGSDGAYWYRKPPGGAWASMLQLDNAGNLTLPIGALTMLSTGPIIPSTGNYSATRIIAPGGLGNNVYFNGAWQRDDTSKPGWLVQVLAQSDLFAVTRWNVSGVAAVPLQLTAVGDLVISGANATKASGTTWANPSDDRLKKDIAPYQNGLASILQLNPITYKFNGKGGSQDDMPGMGFSAQTVQPVMPEMIGTRKGKLDPDDEEETDILTMDQTALALAMVNAFKEIDTRLKALEGR